MIVERAVLHVLHHIVGRIGIPADVEQLYDVAIGGKKNELLDFARQERPIDSATMLEKFNRDLATGVLIDRNPHLAIRTRTQKPQRFITGNRGWGLGTLRAQLNRPLAIVRRLVLCFVFGCHPDPARHWSILKYNHQHTPRAKVTVR